ncbi:Uncharacterised protein [Chlamydia trachomatis]|nr:Uncharacterised protein [Chlamydia trachomatis]
MAKTKNITSNTPVIFSINASKPRFLVCPLNTAPPDSAFKASCCFCGCINVAIIIKKLTMMINVMTKLYKALPPLPKKINH